MANRKVNKQSVRTQSKRRREEERKEKEQFRNRLIAGSGAVLLVVVLVFFVLQLRGTAEEEGAATESKVGEGTLIEGERPLAAMQPAERADFYGAYPETVIDESKSYQAVIRTEKGDMIVQLFDDESPLTVNSFVFLATQGYYDNTVFHRVLPDFMAQAGDPKGDGSGGPGYVFDDEVENGLIFDRPFLLAMAKPDLPDSNGSQFFITFGQPSHLDGIHTIFGELIDGEDVLNSITFIDPQNPVPGVVGDEILRIDIYES